MKIILVDAVGTFISGGVIDSAIFNLLELYQNRKIILTNANDEQLVEFGLINLPYELFTLKHNPDKINPEYFRTMLDKLDLKPEDCVYFEHSLEAVNSAKSVGINSYHYKSEDKDINSLKKFLDTNLKS